jgi:hypothetical protein
MVMGGTSRGTQGISSPPSLAGGQLSREQERFYNARTTQQDTKLTPLTWLYRSPAPPCRLMCRTFGGGKASIFFLGAWRGSSSALNPMEP